LFPFFLSGHNLRSDFNDVIISFSGGIFNLEFSPDGKILSAACEKRNILIFDPLTRRVVQNLENAHQDCVNCVRQEGCVRVG
jgi:WD repeat-containing protein 32